MAWRAAWRPPLIGGMGPSPAALPSSHTAHAALGAPRVSLRRGERDDEGGAAAVGVGRAHVAAVGADDAGHDRQPEPGAGLAALAPALGAPETLEERVRIFGREAGAVVADLEAHLAVLAADVDLHRGVGGGVDERVADEVPEHLAQLVGV